jgi:hypothetical protein
MDETVWEDATGFAERWCAWDGYRRTLGATICTFISLITACFFIFQPNIIYLALLVVFLYLIIEPDRKPICTLVFRHHRVS